jgi:hypothetical protein
MEFTLTQLNEMKRVRKEKVIQELMELLMRSGYTIYAQSQESYPRFTFQMDFGDDALEKCLVGMTSFISKLENSGKTLVFYPLLTAGEFLEFIYQVETMEPRRIFSSGVVVPKGVSMEDFDAYRRSVASVSGC